MSELTHAGGKGESFCDVRQAATDSPPTDAGEDVKEAPSQVEGNGHPCIICGKKCSAHAGNPAMWPSPVFGPTPGKIAWAHMGCIRLALNREIQPRKEGDVNAGVETPIDATPPAPMTAAGDHSPSSSEQVKELQTSGTDHADRLMAALYGKADIRKLIGGSNAEILKDAAATIERLTAERDAAVASKDAEIEILVDLLKRGFKVSNREGWEEGENKTEWQSVASDALATYDEQFRDSGLRSMESLVALERQQGATIERLTRERDEAVKVIERYANPGFWECDRLDGEPHIPPIPHTDEAGHDRGQIARDFLAKREAVVWLIERGQAQGQSPSVWWTGDAWTLEAIRAKRFSSKVECEQYATGNALLTGIDSVHPRTWQATEHIFVAEARYFLSKQEGK